ncbi:amino acid adenylation domain-containing protein [Pseudoalteromonas sp. JBTF-M23]|uniref:Amino acid adenylation domain-containing protein n=1 Tax=Pseudoalteromonas caenipelagi TaxID=2726988 RepID=A0A849VHW5_9GAMM|nr:non-ribosomal peptide synthetase [Pseudoalteromonas caenipelagi]NOU52063.1 amino acid adenylation domain-containing protein [Pseudoalteromonas caenipelagi]
MSMTFWQNQFADLDALVVADPCEDDTQISQYGYRYSVDLTEQDAVLIQHQLAQTHCDLHTLLLLSYYLTLRTMSGQTRFAIGINQQQIAQPNFYTPVVCDLAMQISVQQALKALANAANTNLKHHLGKDVASSEAIILQAANSAGIETLHQATLSLTDKPLASMSLANNHSWQLYAQTQENAISIQILCPWQYSQSGLTLFANCFTQTLRSLISGATKCLAEVDLVPSEQKTKLLKSWQGCTVEWPENDTLVSQLERAAQQWPKRTAVIFQDKVVSYQQLHHQADLLARRIKTMLLANGTEHQSDKQNIIALLLDKSVDMVVAILAVLKTGAAYVPISPQFPAERRRFILEDTQSRLILTQSHYLDCVSDAPYVSMAIDKLDEQQDLQNPTEVDALLPSQLAYVMYTSGTTGQPKGVMISHQSVVNLINYQRRVFDFTQQDKSIWLANYIFDVSVEHFFLTLSSGACLVVPSEPQILDPACIKSLLKDEKITHFEATPTYLSALGEVDAPDIKRVITGGEACTKDVQNLWQQRLVNGYGVTEATVTQTQRCDRKTSGRINNIGKPLANTQIYILSENLQLLPIGAPGDMYIGGVGLAQGYLNRPQLNQEKFIANPFVEQSDSPHSSGGVLYKTGDRARWLENGDIEYLGRDDFQVKIRGYRIELAEIESVITAMPEIDSAVVIDRLRGEIKYLAAYYVLKPAFPLEDAQLKARLQQSLPSYMVPATYTQLEHIPITINGKLDRRALPEPRLLHDGQVEQPSSESEAKLKPLWLQALSLQEVGIHDDFFALGGDSVSALKLLGLCQQQLNCTISLAQLYQHPSIAALALQLSDAQSIVEIPYSDSNKLSYAQQRMLFIEQFEGGTDAYHLPFFTKLAADADIALLEQALQQVVTRHPVLNSCYMQAEDVAQARLTELTQPIRITRVELDSELQLSASVQADYQCPFNLQNGAPMRVFSYSVSQQQFLLIVWHHIAFDGWSEPVFFNELALIYDALKTGTQAKLPELPIRYRDYAQFQHQEQQQLLMRQQLDYWQTELKGHEPLALATDFVRPAQFDYQGATHDFIIDASLTKQLKRIAAVNNTTLYTVMAAAAFVTFYGQTGQRDIVIGTPTDNRHMPQTHGLIGFFVNSLALRLRLSHEQSLLELIQQLHQVIISAKQNQDVPFEQVVQALCDSRDTSRHPIFQVMFSVVPPDNTNELGLLPFVAGEEGVTLQESAKFDLDITLSDHTTHLTGKLVYGSALFSAQRMQWLVESYLDVLQQFADNLNTQLQEVNWVASQHIKQLHNWNSTQSSYPKNKTLTAQIDEAVTQRPDAIALCFADTQVSYAQMNAWVNTLAVRIREQYQQIYGIALSANTFIALQFDKSIEMVIAILAVLRAGGAYVPLSPEFPNERRQFILEDTNSAMLLCTACYHGELKNTGVPLINVECAELAKVEYPFELEPVSQACDLAYVIYTSGTTGKPKGVMLSHDNVSALIASQTQAFGFSEQERVLWLANYIFDVSVEHLFLTLINGACLVIPSQSQIVQPDVINTLLIEQRITHFEATPTYLSALGRVTSSTLKRVITGGEACTAEVAELWGERLINSYGVTEATVTQLQKLQKTQFDSISNLGTPLANTQLYVLNELGQLAPLGAIGELVVAGDLVAKGYLNRPELNAERFISQQPYALSDGLDALKAYKTGDLVRWLPSGEIQYHGRNDFQVKIRGYRIELGEVEAALCQLEQVQQAVVVDIKESQNVFLAAYIVPATGQVCDEAAILNQLSEQLPSYMLPSTLTQVAIIPQTLNGKVDRKALPQPSYSVKTQVIAPRNELEQALYAIWQQILNVEQFGVTDNFFALGGHSLSIAKLKVLIKEQLNTPVELKSLFDNSSIEKQAKLLQTGDLQSSSVQLHEQGIALPTLVAQNWEVTEPFPLSYQQVVFWLINDANVGTVNNVQCIEIKDVIDTALLQQSLQMLSAHHDSLQVEIDLKRPLQKIKECAEPIELNIINCQNMTSSQLAEVYDALETIRLEPFDLTHPPLLVAHLLQFAHDDYVLFLCAPHIIFDGAALSIFARQIEQCYFSLVHGHAFPLAQHSAQLRDFVYWEREAYQTCQNDITAFWQDALRNLHYPTFPAQYQGEQLALQSALVVLSEAQLEKLKHYAQHYDASLQMLMNTLIGMSLSRVTANSEFCITHVMENRYDTQMTDLIALLAGESALPIRVPANGSIAQLLKSVKQHTIAALEYPVISSVMLDAIIEQRRWQDVPQFYKKMLNIGSRLFSWYFKSAQIYPRYLQEMMAVDDIPKWIRKLMAGQPQQKTYRGFREAPPVSINILQDFALIQKTDEGLSWHHDAQVAKCIEQHCEGVAQLEQKYNGCENAIWGATLEFVCTRTDSRQPCIEINARSLTFEAVQALQYELELQIQTLCEVHVDEQAQREN